MTHSFFSWFQMLLGFLGVVSLFLVFFALVALVFFRNKKNNQDIKIQIKSMNKAIEENRNKILSHVLTQDQWKQISKQNKKQEKENAKKKNKDQTEKRIFVLDFCGDIAATELRSLREQITALLQVATDKDEVVVRLESPGGMVHAYGLAASQLARIRQQSIPLTICVDKIAASGGYMMACLAHKIIAAPFAIIGSIGVVANLPNFHRALKKQDVDYLEMTAGEYKRTLSFFGEVTDKGKEKFQEQLEETHHFFKEHIRTYRSQVDVSQIATGEHWLATKALEYKLVDALGTSDDYLLDLSKTHAVYLISSPKKETLKEKLLQTFMACVNWKSHVAPETLTKQYFL